MRLLIASMVLVLVAACGAKQPTAEWRYHRGTYAVPLVYDFGDSENTSFAGVCIPKRSFIIFGGGWEGDRFTLTVDSESWTLPTWQGVEAHGLPVELNAPVQAIAGAKRRIVFQLGNWRRELKPFGRIG